MFDDAKPGYKTTEFWFTVASWIVSGLYMSGAVTTGSAFDKVLAVGAMVLASMGYSISRGIAKKQ